jgi:hypothetical protein
MSATREPVLPPRMTVLPRDKHGRPVPWFVAWIDGVPDFRVIGLNKIGDAERFELCWVCGQHRGRTSAFVIGPMCAVNRVSAEPPSHVDCAEYSARACPFLATPTMRRRPTDAIPGGTVKPAGTMIPRNPGVALVWVTRRFESFPAPGGRLFDIGDPVRTGWYAEGRDATRAEVLASIESGLPLLAAEAEKDGPEGVAHLRRMHEAALTLVPS